MVRLNTGITLGSESFAQNSPVLYKVLFALVLREQPVGVLRNSCRPIHSLSCSWIMHSKCLPTIFPKGLQFVTYWKNQGRTPVGLLLRGITLLPLASYFCKPHHTARLSCESWLTWIWGWSLQMSYIPPAYCLRDERADERDPIFFFSVITPSNSS